MSIKKLVANTMLASAMATSAIFIIPQAQADDSDPLEGFNRVVFKFNDTADRYLLKPVAQGYDYITPKPVDDGVSNVFDNLGEVKNFVNNLLQFKLNAAVTDVGRFAVNSTLGLVGIFDVASHWGMERSEEDFGQTLASWGVGEGAFIMLPLLGPATVRDGFGRIPDAYLSPQFYINDNKYRLGAYALDTIDSRADLLATEDIIEGDRYTFIREVYLQRRDFLVNDGEVEDDFTSDDLDD